MSFAKAYLYIRTPQAGVGTLEQYNRLMFVCQRFSIDVVNLFKDEGVSGLTEPYSRPGMKHMLRTIEDHNGPFVVMANHADQFSRSTTGLLEIYRIIQEQGGELFCVGTDTPTDWRKMIHRLRRLYPDEPQG
jgi:hypothetical protein